MSTSHEQKEHTSGSFTFDLKGILLFYTFGCDKGMFFFLVAIVSIPMERGCAHDAAAGDAVLSTLPGCMEAKVLWSKVLLHSPSSSWYAMLTFPFLVGTDV